MVNDVRGEKACGDASWNHTEYKVNDETYLSDKLPTSQYWREF